MVKKITKSDLPPIPSIDRMANKINENFESIEGGGGTTITPQPMPSWGASDTAEKVQANLVLLANALKTAGILK